MNLLVAKVLQFILPFLWEVFFGKTRFKHMTARERMNLAANAFMGIVIVFAVLLMFNAINKEYLLQEELRGLKPYQERVLSLNEQLDLDLMSDDIVKIRKALEEKERITTGYDELLGVYNIVVDDNEALRQALAECKDTRTPTRSVPRKRPSSRGSSSDSHNRQLLKDLEELW